MSTNFVIFLPKQGLARIKVPIAIISTNHSVHTVTFPSTLTSKKLCERIDPTARKEYVTLLYNVYSLTTINFL